MKKPLVGIQIHPLDPEAIARLQAELGCQYAIAPAWWGDVEIGGDRWDWSLIDWWGQLARHWHGPLPQRLWTLYVVHMNDLGPLPEDLVGVPLDDERVLTRFDAYVRALASHVDFSSQDQPVVVIGNEVDLLVGSRPDVAEQFLRALPSMAAAVRRHIPNARVANSVTFDSARTPGGRRLFDRLLESSDVVTFTFYDWDDNHETVTPSDLAAIIEEMVAIADGTPLVIKEIGLATGAALGSTQENQAGRIRELVRILEAYDRDTLIGAIWLGLDDWDESRMRAFIADQFPDLVGNEGFFQFLTTLGIRTADGRPKLGWEVWRSEVAGYARTHAA